jgi:pSer/pThr/pTyr-binding forkhead associated (FHA) protein
VTRDGQFFVVDTNSTNHTFVNGQMIPPNHETVLNDGDVLTLANESFEFHLR